MTLFERSSGHPSLRTISEPIRDELDIAILQAVTYSDIFDYPLRAAEIHRYLMETSVQKCTLDQRLSAGRLVPDYLSHRDGYFTLSGREEIVETRQHRQQMANAMWPRAMHYGRLIASLPFVRMVAVTGELAMDNMGSHSDIDYFIVTAPGRLWLCRLMVIAVVKYAAPRGDTVCPNFMLSESMLVLDDRNTYTAHEVTQMVPLYGTSTYQRLRDQNPWVNDFLPNAPAASRSFDARQHARPLRMLAEAILRTRVGGWLERWEMERKVRKLSRSVHGSHEASFSKDWCKGHVDGHGERVMSLYAHRWDEVEGHIL